MKYKIQRWLDRFIGIPLVVFFYLYKKLHTFFYPRFTRSKDFSSILAIKLTMLGDTVLLEPSLHAIKQKYPKSKIVFLCSPINEAVVRNWDFVDEVIVFDFKYYTFHPWQIFSFIKNKLRTHHFDIAVDYEEWFRITPLLAYFSGAHFTAGFETEKQSRHLLFDKKIKHRKNTHEIKCYAELTREVFEIENISEERPHITLPSDYFVKVDKILESHGITSDHKYVIIHPGCGSNGILREWHSERYAAVSDYLYQRYSCHIVLTGSNEDKNKCVNVAALMKSPSVNLAGATDFLTLASLVSKARMVICGNTGIVHIASATNTPSVVIHGPTNYVKWGPLARCSVSLKSSLPCYPCLYLGYEYKCHSKKCLDSITTDMVIESVEQVLNCS